jgi:hypothetical protein
MNGSSPSKTAVVKQLVLQAQGNSSKVNTPHPSFQDTFSLKGRRKHPPAFVFYSLLPLREKVLEEQMRGY